jgi:hypothetical protein
MTTTTPRQPNQTATLVNVQDLGKMRTLVKHVGSRKTTYWVMYPSSGNGCPMTFLDSYRNGSVTKETEFATTHLALRMTARLDAQ